MPQTIPTSVFIRKAVIHIFKHFLTWCRAVLVTTVWLIFLPWTMRAIWRMVFWIGDSGWARAYELESAWNLIRTTNMDNKTAFDQIIRRRTHNFTAGTNLTGNPVANYTTGEPLLLRVFRMFVADFSDASGSAEIDVAMDRNITYSPDIDPLIKQKHSSILSDVQFFKTLTTHSAFNRIVMDIGEGLIITLAVVIVFILIFLIREWVIQQQPVIDIGAEANDAAVRNAAAPRLVILPVDDLLAIEEIQQAAENDTEAEPIPSGPSTPSTHNAMDDYIVEGGDANSLNGAPENTEDAADQQLDTQTLLQMTDNLAQQVEEHAQLVEDLNERFQRMTGRREDDVNENQSNLNQLPLPAWRFDPVDPVMPSSREESSTRKNGESSKVSGRPELQTRETSSRATEIQRQLQESIFSNNVTGLETQNESIQPAAEQDPEEHSDVMDQSGIIYTPDSSDDSQNEKKESMQDAVPTNTIRKRRGEIANKSTMASPQGNVEEVGTSTALRSGEGASEKANPIVGSFGSSSEHMKYEDKGTSPFDHLGAQFDENVRAEDQVPSTTTVFAAETPIPATTETHLRVVVAEKKSLTTYLYDLFWGDIAPIPEGPASEQGNDERVIVEGDNDEPFIPFEEGEPVFQAPEPPVAAPNINLFPLDADGEDADPDDAEDLEGVLELIGMQGNIVGLFQNALFSGLLIMGAFLWFVFLPYMVGKTVLLVIGNIDLLWDFPILLVTALFDFVADIFLFLGGHLVAAIGKMLQIIVTITRLDRSFLSRYMVNSPEGFADRAGTRLLDTFSIAMSISDPSLLLEASIQSHHTLNSIRSILRSLVQSTSHLVFLLKDVSRPDDWKEFLLTTAPRLIYEHISSTWTFLGASATNITEFYHEHGLDLTAAIGRSESIPLMTNPNALLAYWSANDRIAAIALGYGLMSLLAALYVSKLHPITSGQQYQRLENRLKDIIIQAGGVFKVIFIISIEMIVFPLFCGFLLDFALLPLFEFSSISSRCLFTISSPWTSGFVHWFVGTCYMFHFALFVSMCRKIMRAGVLYFIRDPDDPNFHPVRDVLERSVSVQLRKIAFSALVYGTLIVVCLGGVVWGLWASSNSILPIHWTSSQSALEFPLDILFYNFLTPIVVRIAKPADGLHAMYQWWFKTCAQSLRLSNFLFGKEVPEEQGHHVRRTWKAWFLGRKASLEENDASEEDERPKQEDVYFVRDGRLVRVPKLDHIRIPKGSPVFVEVDENNQRVDGLEEEGIHANENMVTRVYIPPWFRVRIGLFVFAVWIFAAATGVSVTILPLLFGRRILYAFAQNNEQVNDIYAFSLGIYVLGAAIYSILHLPKLASYIRNRIQTIPPRHHSILRSAVRIATRTLSIIYVYSSFAVLLPILLAFLLELYVLLPLHSFFGTSSTHVVHLVQDWTLGILYIRIFTRILFVREDSMPARILRAVLRPDPSSPNSPGGYLDPNAALATRAFILPALLAFTVLALVPVAGASAFLATAGKVIAEDEKVRVIRLAYPLALTAGACLYVGVVVAYATTRWRARIRDEVYLIGERLHNFGDKGRDKGKAVLRPSSS